MDDLQIAAVELADTGSLTLASQKSGISVERLRTLRADPDFAARVIEHRGVNVLRTASAIQAAAPVAVQVLQEELSLPPVRKRKKVGRPRKDEKFSTDKPDEVETDPRRIRAARIVLEFFFKATELIDLHERLAYLEGKLLRVEQCPQLTAHEDDVIDVDDAPR